MKTLKTFLFMMLAGIGSSAIAHQNTDSLTQAGQILDSFAKGEERPDLLQQLHAKLHQEVITEIEKEAASAGLGRDAYVEDAQSFIAFVQSFQNYDIEQMQRPSLFILLIKAGLRLQIQRSIRFIPEGHFDREKQTVEFLKKISKKLEIPL